MRNVIAFLAVLAAVVATGAAPSPWVAAQAPAASPQFEVASVKPNKSGGGPMRIGFQPGGRFTATNVPVRDLISMAYGQPQPLPNSRSSAARVGWRRIGSISSPKRKAMRSQAWQVRPRRCFSCCAVCSPIASSSSRTRKLAISRFTCCASIGAMESWVRSFVPRRSDCAAMRGANRGGPPPGPPQPGQAPVCGAMFGPGRMMSGGTPIEMLANGLARLVNRVVIDRTGLTGNYESTLEFTPDQSQLPPGGLAARNPGAASRWTVALHGAQGATWLEARIRSRTGPRVDHRQHRAADAGLGARGQGSGARGRGVLNCVRSRTLSHRDGRAGLWRCREAAEYGGIVTGAGVPIPGATITASTSGQAHRHHERSGRSVSFRRSRRRPMDDPCRDAGILDRDTRGRGCTGVEPSKWVLTLKSVEEVMGSRIRQGSTCSKGSTGSTPSNLSNPSNPSNCRPSNSLEPFEPLEPFRSLRRR